MERYKCIVEELLSGMILSEDVMINEDQVLIPRGTELTPRMIARLKFYSVTYVYICGQGNKRKSLDYFKKIETTIEFKHFNRNFKKMVASFSDNINNAIQSAEEINTEQLMEEVSNVIKDSRNGIHLMQMMHCIRKYDDLTYVHSMNVSLICNVIGGWLGYSEEQQKLLTLCGLLHDVGKLVIPAEILTKPGRLTEEEYEVIKTHPLRGYELLKDKNLDEQIKLGALQHHERCDGSGYPYGINGDEISDFAKIVAIADVYDAMTANRVYREGICPFDVMDSFEKEGYQKYDPKFLIPFLERISQCYIHTNVNLSNQQQGEVVMINQGELARPIVKVEDQYIDLSQTPEVTITGLV